VYHFWLNWGEGIITLGIYYSMLFIYRYRYGSRGIMVVPVVVEQVSVVLSCPFGWVLL